MASSEPQKILRVGVIQNGTFIEERLMRKPQPVTIGSNFKNTFAISAAGVPSTTVLFDCKGGEYTLQFDQNMSGRVAVGQRAHKLEDLRKDGRAEKKGELWILKLDQKSRGKVEVGDVIFLFQFVAPPPNRAAPQLPAAMRGGPFHFFVGTTGLTGAFGLILLLSLILQGGFITYLVLEVPPPPRPTGIGDLPDEIRLMLTERDEEPEEVEQPEPDEVEETEVSDEATEVAEVTNDPEPEREEPEPEPQPRIDPPAANREERLQVARERAQESSLFSALSTSDNGTGGAMDQVFNVSDRRLDTIMDRQAARGESALANAGAAGGSADPSGDSQTVAVDVNASSRTREAANEVSSGREREQVRVSARIRDQEARSAGSGRLDADYLDRRLSRYNSDIQRCYERVLPDNPDLEGRIELQFTIGSSGRVEDAELRRNELNDEVARCIEGRVRRWRFDAPEGGSLTVRKIYILTNSGG